MMLNDPFIDKFSKKFKRITNKELDDNDRHQLKMIKEVCGIRDTDSLWLIILIFQHYLSLYKEIPEKVRSITYWTLNDFYKRLEITTDIAVKNAIEKNRTHISKAVSDISSGIVYKSAIDSWKLICFSAVFIAFVLICLFVYTISVEKRIYSKAYSDGFGKGTEYGYKMSYDEQVRSSWANTENGKICYELSNTKTFNNLIKCNNPGWFVKDGFCFVEKTNDGKLYGWMLPR